MRTASTIINSFMKRVTDKEPIGPDEWMTAAQYLNVLIGLEAAKLAEAEQEYVKEALKWVQLGDSNAVAEKKAKGTPAYLDYKKQQAFVKQVEEFIRLAKKQATISYEQGA